MSTRLADVADLLPSRVFRILHDTFTGKPTIGATPVRCAVVGAQVAPSDA